MLDSTRALAAAVILRTYKDARRWRCGPWYTRHYLVKFVNSDWFDCLCDVAEVCGEAARERILQMLNDELVDKLP
jgi:hypothetical protein